MKFQSLTLLRVLSAVSFSTASAAEPTATPMLWRGIAAHRLTDGLTEAVVVPPLGGRVMHYGPVGGRNMLWNGADGLEKKPPAVTWGGDKTYLGPHSGWGLQHGSAWPPPAPDFQPAEVIAPVGIFSTLGAPWPGSGARIQRDYAFAADGALVITHRVAPVPGSREIAALWTVTQILPPAAAFVPLAAASPYQDGCFWFDFAKPVPRPWATLLSPRLLRIMPVPGIGFKMGAHPEFPALAAFQNEFAFLQTAEPQPGQYPEGADGAGLSVEVYHHDQRGDGAYMELEFLSALRRLDAGLTLTTRWSLHRMELPAAADQMPRLLKLEAP
jgi:hypothetical protein